MMKVNSMMQWIECNQNNRFVDLPSLPWLSKVSGAVHLVLSGLTAGGRVGGRAGGRAGRQEGRQMKCRGILKFLKLTVHRNIQLFALFTQGTAPL